LVYRMSPQKSPFKLRNTNANENSMRRKLGKKQLKRKSSLFGGSNAIEPPKKRLFDMYDDSLDNSFGDNSSTGNSIFNTPKPTTSPVKKFVIALPMDLRLGTKVRIISEKPFPFSDSTNNNYSSLISFNSSVIDESCRLLAQTDFSDIQQSTFKNACPLTILKSAGIYYQYPDISFMQMFPRLDGVARQKGIRESMMSFGNEVVDSIQAEWLHSFDHLYNSWKNGKRNSFYVCGPQFTILFVKVLKPAVGAFDSEETCMGLNDFWEHRVVITPTSCGLRKLLKKNEIPFVLPVSARRLSNGANDSCASFNDSTYYSDSFDVLNNSSSTPFKKEGTPEKENITTEFDYIDEKKPLYVSPLKLGEDVEQEGWLRGIGYSPSKMRMATADSQDQSTAEETVKSIIASSAGSTIAIVQLSAIDAFKKLMLDLNLGWARTGQQAGLPPTLIATDPFMNSALKSLNFKTQVLQKADKTQYTMDVDNGPILPHVPQLLHEFLRGCANQLDDNTLKFHVTGRSACNGINEATAEMYKNINEFTFHGFKSRYFY